MRIIRVSVESSSRLLGTTLAVDPLVTISALTSWSSTFEIVEKVSTDKLESFAEYYHRNIYPDFKVKAFSYESDRQWQEVEEAPYHLVIVFMEPSSLESRELLGLDIGSNEFLVRSSQKSEQQEESAVSTDPFTLVQGHLAYLLQRPIAEFGNADSSMYEDKRSGE